eukprot:SAG31_NODE_6800_length_1881_cov_1.253363_1_plen_144_part_00
MPCTCTRCTYFKYNLYLSVIELLYALRALADGLLCPVHHRWPSSPTPQPPMMKVIIVGPPQRELLPWLLLLLLHGLASAAEIDLDGHWSFEADLEDIGVAQRWFDAAAKPRLPMRMAVPGAWQSFADGARGVGVETPLLRKQF